MLQRLFRLFFNKKIETGAQKLNRIAIQAGFGIHVPDFPDFPRIKYPTKRGKPPEQYAREVDLWKDYQHRGTRAVQKYHRDRFKDCGATEYIWRAHPCAITCPECAENHGKRFKVSKGSKIGHPGDHRCLEAGYCKCWAAAVIPPP